MAKAKKTKRSKARKARAKSKTKTSKRVAKRTKKTGKKTRASASRQPTKAKAGKKAPTKRAGKQRMIGEGDYEASRSFLKDQSDFVKSHEADIPRMGKAAERAMEGAEGKDLRAAEEEAKSRSKAMGE